MIRRRKPERSGIERVERRRIESHKKWVRGHECAVPSCASRDITFAHVRNGIPYADRGGMGLKSRDTWGIPLCSAHHGEQGPLGEDRFDRKHGIDRHEIARQLQAESPHLRKLARETESANG